jgi:hypothetical protein
MTGTSYRRGKSVSSHVRQKIRAAVAAVDLLELQQFAGRVKNRREFRERF